MSIHSLLIFSFEQKTLVFAKHFDMNLLHQAGASSLFESKARQLLLRSAFSDSSPQSISQHSFKQSCRVETNIYSVYDRHGDLLILLSGTNSMDEIILGEVIDVIKKVIEDILDLKGPLVTVASFMGSENYGKFSVSMDDMMPEGIIETLDVDAIGKLSKLKNT